MARALLTTLLGLLSILAVSTRPAAANVLFVPTWGERLGRTHFGLYATSWEFSDRRVLESVGGKGFRQDADPSAVLLLEYDLTDRLSIGGWWNPFAGSVVSAVAFQPLGIRPGDRILGYEANYFDVHLTYRLSEKSLRFLGPRFSRGWTLQGGYSSLRYEVRTTGKLTIGGAREAVFNLGSPNIWLSRSGRLASPRIGGRERPIRAFGSIGYHTSDDFNHALNLIVGGSLDISKSLSINTDVWLNDLSSTNLRLTFGVTGRF